MTEQQQQQQQQQQQALVPPDDWGTVFWDCLHTAAFLSPLEPTEEEQKSSRDFVSAWTAKLPCTGDCRGHFVQLLQQKPPVVSTRFGFATWTVDVHNDVNARLGKPANFTIDQAIDRYMGRAAGPHPWYANHIHTQRKRGGSRYEYEVVMDVPALVVGVLVIGFAVWAWMRFASGSGSSSSGLRGRSKDKDNDDDGYDRDDASFRQQRPDTIHPAYSSRRR